MISKPPEQAVGKNPKHIPNEQSRWHNRFSPWLRNYGRRRGPFLGGCPSRKRGTCSFCTARGARSAIVLYRQRFLNVSGSNSSPRIVSTRSAQFLDQTHRTAGASILDGLCALSAGLRHNSELLGTQRSRPEGGIVDSFFAAWVVAECSELYYSWRLERRCRNDVLYPNAALGACHSQFLDGPGPTPCRFYYIVSGNSTASGTICRDHYSGSY